MTRRSQKKKNKSNKELITFYKRSRLSFTSKIKKENTSKEARKEKQKHELMFGLSYNFPSS